MMLGTMGLTCPVSLRTRLFRWFLLCQVVAATGLLTQEVVLNFLVYKHHGVWALCGVAELQMAPMALGAFLIGRLADRFPRRTLLLLLQGGMCLQAAVLGALQFTGALSLWPIYGLVILFGLFFGAEVVVEATVVREMVTAVTYENAQYLNSLALGVGLALGGLLGGLLATRPALAFAFNALSFLPSLVFLKRLRLGRRRMAARTEKVPFKEALVYLRNHKSARLGLLVYVATGACYGHLDVTLSLLGVGLGGAKAYASLMAANCLGKTISAASQSLDSNPATVAKTFRWAVLCLLASMCFGGSYWLPVSILCIMLVQYGAMGLNVSSNALLVREAPLALQGRLQSVYRTLWQGSLVFSILQATIVTTIFGVHVAVMGEAGIGLLLVTILFMVAFRFSPSFFLL